MLENPVFDVPGRAPLPPVIIRESPILNVATQKMRNTVLRKLEEKKETLASIMGLLRLTISFCALTLLLFVGLNFDAA